MEATYRCIARWGLAKTTVADAAREAGVSRATVYRAFPGGREELVDATISWEVTAFFQRLYDEVHDAPTLEAVLERGLPVARRAIRGHQVLQRILETEPEVLLPVLSVESDRILALIAQFLLPYLERHGVVAGVDMEEAAGFLSRMVLSYISSPGRWDLDDPAQVGRLVRAELLAGIAPPSRPGPRPLADGGR